MQSRDLSRGVVRWTALPRFSNGYGDARHLPTVLVENHSLKPFDRRVLGTYVFLESVLESLGRHGDELRAAVETDRARRPDSIPLAWRIPEDAAPESGELLGVEYSQKPSPVSGALRVTWTGKPVVLEVP